MTSANKTFKALSDPVRRKILELLKSEDLSAGEISKHFKISKPALSRHFAILSQADLIVGEKKGNSIIYSLKLSVVEEALLGLLSTIRKYEL